MSKILILSLVVVLLLLSTTGLVLSFLNTEQFIYYYRVANSVVVLSLVGVGYYVYKKE